MDTQWNVFRRFTRIEKEIKIMERISEEIYKESLRIISLYKEQLRKDIESKIPDIKKVLDKYFEKTYIKEFSIGLDKKWYDDSYTLNITSYDPIFDEDYGGEFDKDMEKLSKEFGIEIRFESGNYSK
jgi:hypothetical protein